MIHKPSRGGDYHVRPIIKFDGLRNHIHPADNDGRSNVERRTEHCELFCNLERQLPITVGRVELDNGKRTTPCWSEHQRKDAVWVNRKFLQNGQRKRDGLARTRLGVPYAISTFRK